MAAEIYKKEHRWFRYWDIILFRTVANIKAEAQKTYAGYLWWFLEPFINTVTFYVIFTKIIGSKTPNFMVFLIVGTVMWQWMQTTVIISSQSVIQKAFLLQNVYLPKYLFPLVTVLTNSFKFFFLFMVLLIILWCSGYSITWAYLWLPVLLAIQFLLISSFSVLMACFMPYFPDGEIVLDALLRSLMLVSGIFFHPSNIPDHLLGLFYLNPMAHLIIAYRGILLEGVSPSLQEVAYVTAFSLALTAFSYWFYKKVDRQMVKVITQG